MSTTDKKQYSQYDQISKEEFKEGNKIIQKYFTSEDGIFQPSYKEYQKSWDMIMEKLLVKLQERNPSVKLSITDTRARLYSKDLDSYQTMTLTTAKVKEAPRFGVWLAIVKYLKEFEKITLEEQ